MNDVLHHATRTLHDTKAFVPSASTQYLSNLLKSTQSAEGARADKVTKVLKLWTDKAYFSDDELAQIAEKPLAATTEKPVESKPLVKPSMLGRAGDPHWLLPVSCMLEAMVPPPPPTPQLTKGILKHLQTYSPLGRKTPQTLRKHKPRPPQLRPNLRIFPPHLHLPRRRRRGRGIRRRRLEPQILEGHPIPRTPTTRRADSTTGARDDWTDAAQGGE
jgi:CID domain